MVGGGVLTLLHRLSSTLPLTVPTMVVRDPSKPRTFDVPPGTRITGDVRDVLDDDTITMVIEVMGGTGKAKDVVFEALKKGKVRRNDSSSELRWCSGAYTFFHYASFASARGVANAVNTTSNVNPLAALGVSARRHSQQGPHCGAHG